MQRTDGLLDIGLQDPNTDVDQGLESAVLVSLFTDARAQDDDVIPDGSTDQRGHWADSYSDSSLGSRLWLLHREKQLPEVLSRAKDYVYEALQWLMDDNVASAITVDAYWSAAERLALDITIQKADGGQWQRTFDYELKAA